MGTTSDRQQADRKFFTGLARAFGGAVFFSLPLLMTMEMWYLGFYLERSRILLFMLLILPVLIVLDRFSGFMETSTWTEDAIDGVVAFGVGATTAALILYVLGVITPDMTAREVAGKIALQAVPGSFGAVLANSQFDADRESPDDRATQHRARYRTQLFFMFVGALFLAFNIAPTEEIVLLAATMAPLQALALILLTLFMMHAFVYAARFRGAPDRPHPSNGLGLFLRYTLVGYAVALLVCAAVLWTFGRIQHPLNTHALLEVIVLAVPGGLGAAAARLVL